VKKLILLILVILFIVSGMAHAFTISVDPPSVTISSAPKESKSGTIMVANRGKGPLKIKAYVQDWVYAKDRSKEFKAAGSTPYSCANWINIFPTEFELSSQGEQAVTFTITVPENAKGGHQAVIFFDAQAQKEKPQKTGVIVIGSIGTIIYQETEGNVNKEASISDFSTSWEKGVLTAQLKFKNQGNTHLSAEGSLVLLGKNGLMAGRVKIPKINLLPGETIPAKVKWQGKVEEGEYKAVATLDYGGEEPAVAETTVKIK
jgi:P pilus assembly chaperone PapD